MDRTGARAALSEVMDGVNAGRYVLAFVLAALPFALMPATCPSESGGDFKIAFWPAVWPGLLVAGLLGGVLLRGWSGAAILIGGMGAGLLVCAAVSQPNPWNWGFGWRVCGAPTDPERLLFLGAIVAPILAFGYGITRSLARSIQTPGRLPEVTPGRVLLSVGTFAWLLAQFLPAWTYTSIGINTEAGVWFTFLPLGYLMGPGIWLAWPANLLLAGAWALVLWRSSYAPAAWLAASATVCAIGGVWIELTVGQNHEVVEIGTEVWCASFAVLAVALAVREVETRRREPAHAGRGPGTLAPPA